MEGVDKFAFFVQFVTIWDAAAKKHSKVKVCQHETEPDRVSFSKRSVGIWLFLSQDAA